ncbi:MAG: tetratricopeptide repeat protein [Brevinematales bacterium]
MKPEPRFSFFLLVFLVIVFSQGAISLDEATANYIHNLYQKKSYTEVMTETRTYLTRFPLSSLFASVAILGGESAYKEKNYYLGRYFFEQAFKKTKDKNLLRQSLLGMAKCTYKTGAYQDAAKLFETYVTEFDDPLVNPAALYYAYVCALASGNPSEATRYQRWLADQYPDSPYLSLLSDISSPTSPQSSSSASTGTSNEVSLNKVPLTVPQLVQENTTNTIIITNWITLTTTNQITNIASQPVSSTDENSRYLSLLEVKAKLLQLKSRTLDEELAALGIGGTQ